MSISSDSLYNVVLLLLFHQCTETQQSRQSLPLCLDTRTWICVRILLFDDAAFISIKSYCKWDCMLYSEMWAKQRACLFVIFMYFCILAMWFVWYWTCTYVIVMSKFCSSILLKIAARNLMFGYVFLAKFTAYGNSSNIYIYIYFIGVIHINNHCFIL